MPNRSRTTRLPSLTFLAINGRSRLVLFKVHSLCATITLGPNSFVDKASLNIFFISPTLKVLVTVFAHSTPTPRTARSIGCLVERISLEEADDSKSWPPVAALYALSTTTTNPFLTNFSGIQKDDPILLWGGGVYVWFDPLTLIEAVNKVKNSIPNIRLVFMGGKHPNPDVPVNKIVQKAIDLANSYGLLNKNVYFNDQWVDYNQRHNYLFNATIGVSTHYKSLETQFSFRTRILDYLWAGLPIITTEGDYFADVVREEKCGEVVKQRDAEDLAKAIIKLLDKTNLESARKNSLRLREEFRWNKVLKPVLEYCANPYKVKKNPLALKRHPRKTPTYYYRRIGEIKREEGIAGILRKTAKKLHLPGAKFY